MAINRLDSPTYVYVMVLRGAAAHALKVTQPGYSVIKVGMTQDPLRRVGELNDGFPPGALAEWMIERIVPYRSGDEAWHIESACLEALRQAGYWIGGEYAAVPTNLIMTIIPDE